MLPRSRNRAISPYRGSMWRCSYCRARVDAKSVKRATYGTWVLYYCPICTTPLFGRGIMH
jgi:uncharacterized protein YlaI